MTGTYRHVIANVKNFHWKIFRYSHPNADLIASDLDIMKNKEAPTDLPGNNIFKDQVQFAYCNKVTSSCLI